VEIGICFKRYVKRVTTPKSSKLSGGYAMTPEIPQKLAEERAIKMETFTIPVY
jgi:hypothetical protein